MSTFNKYSNSKLSNASVVGKQIPTTALRKSTLIKQYQQWLKNKCHMYKKIIFITLFVWALNTNAQTIRFQKTYDYNLSGDYFSNVCIDSEKNATIIQNFLEPHYAKGGLIFTKIDSNGNKSLGKVLAFDSTVVVGPTHLLHSSEGYYYTSTNIYHYRYRKTKLLFIKFNQYGDTMFVKIIDSLGSNFLNRLIESYDKKIIAIGYLGVPTNGYKSQHECIIKLDTNGKVIWKKFLGISINKNTYGHGVVETLNHQYIVNGTSYYATHLPAPNPIYDENFFVTRTDSLGNIIWQKEFGNATLYESGEGIIKGKNMYYLLGYQDSFKLEINPPYKHYDETVGLLYGIDDNGLVLWKKKYIDTAYYTILKDGFAVKANQLVLLANKIRSAYNTKIRNGEPTIIKIDSVGNTLWERQHYLNDSLNITPFQVTLCTDSGYIVSGYVKPVFVSQKGTIDGYLLKVDKYGCLTDGCQLWDGVEEVIYYSANEIGQLVVYPNPATNQLTVISHQLIVNTIEITDVLGRVVLAVTPSPLERAGVRLDVSDLANGIYFIKATNEKGNVSVGKFVKE